MADENLDRPFTPATELPAPVPTHQGIIMRQVPNPGSREACNLGCTCPQEGNLHGRCAFQMRPDGGINYVVDKWGKPVFILDRMCPQHGGEAPSWFLQNA
jgi:hypothetical protein